ncbi:glutamine synthetase [Frankia sp. AgB1.9]|uniref:glutamine synthetase family protein n=1 Tax=unclassified Frankia TaxID=2632575 RepID=UPI0019328BA3|nr:MULTISPECIES: glutamine synthetase family protein [unclassified Frankia]MBL7494522.1 glutamine synthetase [Frankia sp. AgW1.1]MBL7553138.1 glutamine synthetase [Frankia sp. AgB1.9]MBL7618148.1 glutamine synthetase [Frankia sp. AgB1.8]
MDGEKAASVTAELRARGVDAVALTFVDNSGITRAKCVPVGRLERAAVVGVGASPSFDAFLLNDDLAAGRYAGGPVGDLRLRPDLDRVVPLAAQPGWAWAPADRFDQLGRPHPQDTRAILRREAEGFAERYLPALAGIEIEWTIYPARPDGGSRPAAAGPAYGLERVIEQADYLRDIVRALTEQGLTVEQIHPEYAPGQFEVSTAPEDPLGAADSSVLVRQTIRAVGARHGLRTSFSPAVVAAGVGNGGHAHVSLRRAPRAGQGSAPRAGQGSAARASQDSARRAGQGGSGEVLIDGTGPAGLSALGEHFAAGILAHLPALLAVGAPSVASYLRLRPSRWAGAFACWGVENREAALRLVTGLAVGGQAAQAPDSDLKASAEQWFHASPHLEIKCFDLTANPYLMLAGVLACGRSGIEDGARLPEPVDVDPATLPAAERARRGIEALPGRLAEAVDAFEADPVLRAAFGVELHDTIVTVRRAEIELFAAAGADEVVAQSLWRH